jgi:hypothetical protein
MKKKEIAIVRQEPETTPGVGEKQYAYHARRDAVFSANPADAIER